MMIVSRVQYRILKRMYVGIFFIAVVWTCIETIDEVLFHARVFTRVFRTLYCTGYCQADQIPVITFMYRDVAGSVALSVIVTIFIPIAANKTVKLHRTRTIESVDISL